jgi:phosphoribosylformimino-5-aminoimidazole carboxamide ribotide isomerase
MIFTDIVRDGALQGPNVDAVRHVCGMTKMKVFASGGVSSFGDIVRLKTTGAAGCIVGKALYSGDLSLEKALSAAL